MDLTNTKKICCSSFAIARRCWLALCWALLLICSFLNILDNYCCTMCSGKWIMLLCIFHITKIYIFYLWMNFTFLRNLRSCHNPSKDRSIWILKMAVVQFLGLAMVCIGDSVIPPADLSSGCCTIVVWLWFPAMIYGQTALSRKALRVIASLGLRHAELLSGASVGGDWKR